jgi:hypothetical protein
MNNHLLIDFMECQPGAIWEEFPKEMRPKLRPEMKRWGQGEDKEEQ